MNAVGSGQLRSVRVHCGRFGSISVSSDHYGQFGSIVVGSERLWLETEFISSPNQKFKGYKNIVDHNLRGMIFFELRIKGYENFH